MEIQRDGKGQPYIEWKQTAGCFKRAWIQHRYGDKDWAGTGRYLNVVRCNSAGRPGGNATDFPTFNDEIGDEQILLAFAYAVNAMTGWTASPVAQWSRA